MIYIPDTSFELDRKTILTHASFVRETTIRCDRNKKLTLEESLHIYSES